MQFIAICKFTKPLSADFPMYTVLNPRKLPHWSPTPGRDDKALICWLPTVYSSEPQETASLVPYSRKRWQSPYLLTTEHIWIFFPFLLKVNLCFGCVSLCYQRLPIVHSSEPQETASLVPCFKRRRQLNLIKNPLRMEFCLRLSFSNSYCCTFFHASSVLSQTDFRSEPITLIVPITLS